MERTLKEWLAEVGNEVYGLAEATVTIGRSTYEAVFYRQMVDRKGALNTRGEVIEPYEVEAVVLVGEPPSAYRRSSKTVFVLEGNVPGYDFGADGDYWYVVTWTRVEVANDPRFAAYHFDGKPTVQLRPWVRADLGEIDVPYERAYDRVKAQVSPRRALHAVA